MLVPQWLTTLICGVSLTHYCLSAPLATTESPTTSLLGSGTTRERKEEFQPDDVLQSLGWLERNAPKLMIVGDSISEGAEGDWTWRFRLWQWLNAEGVEATFLGPYTGTRDAAVPKPPSPPPLGDDLDHGGYMQSDHESEGPPVHGNYHPHSFPADNDEGKAHFSVWGEPAAWAKEKVKDVVQLFQPDYLLIELGVNDMGWLGSTVDDTLLNMHLLIEEARKAKPNVKFAVADVPHRSPIAGLEGLDDMITDYNAQLRLAIPEWSGLLSPVKLVDFSGNYDCNKIACAAGYDGLHPNALGEHQIAKAFSQTLIEYGIGKRELEIPSGDAIGYRKNDVPSNITAEPTEYGIAVTWSREGSVRGYDVRARLVNSGAWLEYWVEVPKYDQTWTEDGQKWEFSIRVDNANAHSEWSEPVQAVSHPECSSGVRNAVVLNTTEGLKVRWDPPTGKYSDSVDRYEILYRDLDVEGSLISGHATTKTEAIIPNIVAKDTYMVFVTAWNKYGQSMPESANPPRPSLKGRLRALADRRYERMSNIEFGVLVFSLLSVCYFVLRSLRRHLVKLRHSPLKFG